MKPIYAILMIVYTLAASIGLSKIIPIMESPFLFFAAAFSISLPVVLFCAENFMKNARVEDSPSIN